jgi:hypothetical protein
MWKSQFTLHAKSFDEKFLLGFSLKRKALIMSIVIASDRPNKPLLESTP